MQQARIAAWGMVMQDFSLLLRNYSGQPNLEQKRCSFCGEEEEESPSVPYNRVLQKVSLRPMEF